MGVFSFVKAGKKIFGAGKAIKSVKPNVPKTKLEKLKAQNRIATQRLKGAEAKLKQTQFEIKNPKTKKDDKFTFEGSKKKTESNKERFKRIQKENTKVIKKFIAPKDFNKGGRVGKMGGGMMDEKTRKEIQKQKVKLGLGVFDEKGNFQAKKRKKMMGGGMMGRRFGMDKGGKVPTTPKEKSLAKLAPPKDKITFGDVIAGRTKKAGGGPAMSKLPAKEEMKQKAQKRMTAANKFLKNRKRSFGSIMREKHMR